MAISFPLNPSIGDEYSAAGKTWTWNGSQWEGVPSTSGIPFGATADRPSDALGQPFFNGEEGRLELFTSGTGWQNIVQETPGVVSVVGTYIEGDSSAIITINGSNFASGAIASVIGQDGTEIIADTTQLVSVAELAATFSGLSATNEPYDVKVLNPSNLYGIAFDILQIDDTPVFITQSGSLGNYVEGSPMSVQISAADEEDSPLIFSILSGTLPAGLSLNTSTGEISGTPSGNITSSTTSAFEISVTDGNSTNTRSFSVTITDLGPVWQTSSITSFVPGQSYSYTVSAIDDDGHEVSYSVLSGSLPSGLSLNSSTGEISGTPSNNSASTVTLRATDTISSSVSDKQFEIKPAGVLGGSVSDSNGYRYHTFASSGTLEVNELPTNSTVEYLVVAGGGGGRTRHSGGGGAGGYISNSQNLALGSYTITIGAGGNGSGTTEAPGSDGTDSSVFSQIAVGGGGGSATDERSGGSGGGVFESPAGSGIFGQGNDGGVGGFSGGEATYAGGGGGGAGATGGNATISSVSTGGAGGNGRQWLDGNFYAGGGGGGTSAISSSNSGGAAGSGGGGRGGPNTITGSPGQSGAASTGGGGGGGGFLGGSNYASGNGGSGVVIVRYAL